MNNREKLELSIVKTALRVAAQIDREELKGFESDFVDLSFKMEGVEGAKLRWSNKHNTVAYLLYKKFVKGEWVEVVIKL
jgi:hypothetical protein